MSGLGPPVIPGAKQQSTACYLECTKSPLLQQVGNKYLSMNHENLLLHTKLRCPKVVLIFVYFFQRKLPCHWRST